MKKLLFVFLFIFSLSISFAQRIKIDGCEITRYYGMETFYFSAYGNVYVETDPKEPVDLRVKVIVDSNDIAHFHIYKTSDKPQGCGEWRFVKDRSKAKFTIRYVKEHEDCKIRFVNNRSDAGGWGNIEY